MDTCTQSDALWAEHGEKIEAFICSKVGGEDPCQDILHDVFLKIRDNQERIQWMERPASYVIKMAQNAIVDYYRNRKQSNPIQMESTVETTDAEIRLADCCLMAFIQKLPPVYSEALLLTELQGISQKELAERLNISYTGAKSRVQRARKMLKEAILACCPYQFDKYGNIIGCCK